jgi:DNA-binding CsgD family transcriptional regulator
VDVAEIAITARSQECFRLAALERIRRVLDVDACVLNELTQHGTVTVHGLGLDIDHLRPILPSYLAEITNDEFQSASRGRFILDREVFTARRKDELRMYSEYMRPRGFCHYAARLWSNPHGTFLMTIFREGRRLRYSGRDLGAVDALFSALALGEALHASGTRARRRNTYQRALYAERGLNAPECAALDLLRRGLRAPEAALLLGTPPNVVLDHGAAAVRKLVAQNATRSRGRAPTRHIAPGSASTALSPRESDVLRLLLAGLSDKEIGASLSISHHTVNEHTKRIYRHLNVHSRAALIARYSRSS